ncbi:Cy196 [Cynomolgus cytomegalovirus]|uniref:Protein US14c n=1 Tax=Cynomolgus macaque cytomegalovirus strain Mauritius TaxID=1690255 RepID=A0A0K1GZU5_9BETA|nr:Cy196 [Cynomolgus cytomegalovirus]AKT72738.1 protein US14c [Cynomolgus macaque cytomegalovirus strain Mauritius]AXG21932.1 protein US14c [synthetic construct]APT39397.1 Cy196 [Cynomolgus cytomegalovirus]APT39548.1 Cy196 [Cynomolgus cytomegalovirus]APT39743.1 Cy196 [Cynomolgus cytomegalovirus]
MESEYRWHLNMHWLRRFTMIFQVYAWLGMEVAVTVAMYGVYRTARPYLTVDCVKDPAPLLMMCIPAAILIVENTPKRIAHTIDGLFWELYYMTVSCLLVSTCTDDWTVFQSFLLTALMFILQSAAAVFDNMQMYRRKMLAMLFSMTVLFTMSLIYSFGHLAPSHMLFITMYFLFLVLTSIDVYMETVAIRHKHPVDEIRWPSIMLYVNWVLLYEANVMLLTPGLWSARWDGMFSSLIAYFKQYSANTAHVTP